MLNLIHEILENILKVISLVTRKKNENNNGTGAIKGKPIIISIVIIILITVVYAAANSKTIISEFKQYILHKEPVQANVTDTSTIENKLLQAETYYDSKNYNESMLIYKDLCQYNIPIAQLNLAYFYSNGIGMEVNIEQAITLYKQCAHSGNKEAIVNLIALYANKHPLPMKDFIEILDFAKDYNIPIVNKLLAYTMSKKDIEVSISDSKIIELSSKFYQLSYGEKESIINGSLFWELSGTAMGKSIPISDDNTEYISNGSRDVKDGDNSASYLVFDYTIRKLKSRYSKILEESFFYMYN
jgi:FOG: TPR repeat, SEL1 subfamily